MKISGIYIIENLSNGKRYVGSSKEVHKRWRKHRGDLKNNRHGNSHLQSSWNKYGENNFKFFILEECEENLLIEREEKAINELKPEYNKTTFSGGRQIKSESHKLKLALANVGKKATEETKLKMSLKRKGIKFSEEHKKRISENNYRKAHPESLMGDKNPSAKLSWESVRQIRKLYESGETSKEIATKFNICLASVSNIAAGRSWKEQNTKDNLNG